MRARAPLIRVLREPISRCVVVVLLEYKIVAEDRPMAGARQVAAFDEFRDN
jgi:hypothetical protein